MNKRPSTKWYVQEDQKIKGPYSPQEIQALLNEGKIRGKSLVSGGPKNNHSKTVNDLVKPLADPVYSLFNALQFAKNLTVTFSRELARTPLVRYQSKMGMLLGIGFALLVSMVFTIIYFNRIDFVNPFQGALPAPLIRVKPTPSVKEKPRVPVPRRPIAVPIIQKPVETPPPKPDEPPQTNDDYPPQPTPEPDLDSYREPASYEEERPVDTPPPQPEFGQENPPDLPPPAIDLSE
ncbi:MAG: hypothetical protein ABIQ95_05005 [Bdellovibrionia bacterium]